MRITLKLFATSLDSISNKTSNGIRNMTRTDKREQAKELLIDALAVAYYKLEDVEYNYLTEEDKDEIRSYINQYGKAMATRIGKEYYTM